MAYRAGWVTLPRMAGMDLQTAYGKLALLDPEMGRLVERLGRPGPFSFSPILSRVGEDRFRALMLSIISQQISAAAA